MKTSKSVFLILFTFLVISCSTSVEKTDKKEENVELVVEIENNEVIQSENVSFLDEKSEIPKKASTPNFLKQFEKKAQIFFISTKKDTIINCKEGTSIKVLKNSFVNEKTGKQITGEIKISVKEYYKLSDIVLANLSTTSDGKILETGGMIYISATSDKQKCILKKGKEIEIGFPTSSKKKDMQLFSGEWNDNNLNWKPLNISEKEEFSLTDDTLNTDSSSYGSVYVIVENPAKPIGGYSNLYKNISRKIHYPFSALKKKVEGKVYVQFVVDKLGEIRNIKIMKGLDPLLDKVAYDIISKMPKWEAATQRGQLVNQKVVIPITFSLKNIKLTERVINKSKKYEEYIKSIEMISEDFIFTSNDATNNYIPRNENYLFNATRFGWINCDRFTNDKRKKVNYSVQVGEFDKVTTIMIFHSVKSIMAGAYRTNTAHFYNVPLGEKVTLVVLRNENDKRFIAIKKTRIDELEEKNLEFKPITIADLKTGLAKIDGIKY